MLDVSLDIGRESSREKSWESGGIINSFVYNEKVNKEIAMFQDYEIIDES